MKDKTNLKAKNNQNRQKIKLYGSLVTKELKKKYSSRLIGGAEMGSRVERTHTKAVAGGPGWASRWLVDWVVPHSHADKPGGTTGEQDRLCNPGLQYREIKPLSL